MVALHEAAASAYVSWLRRHGVAVFEAAGCQWRRYHGRVLIPASLAPTYCGVEFGDAQEALRQSGTDLLRFSSDPGDGPTDWWYILCNRYDPQTFSHKTRQKINKGRRECRIDRVGAEWLAAHGYSCHVAAHARYSGSLPAPEARWRAGVLATGDGPFEYWAVFVGEQLAGYCQCVIETPYVTTAAGKYDPAFFKHRTVNALTSFLGEHYVRDRQLILANGNRAILHDTNMQSFLMDHGFHQQFCRLNVVYRPWLGLTVKSVFPLRHLLRKAKKPKVLESVNTLLMQEEIRRSCLLSPATAR